MPNLPAIVWILIWFGIIGLSCVPLYFFFSRQMARQQAAEGGVDATPRPTVSARSVPLVKPAAPSDIEAPAASAITSAMYARYDRLFVDLQPEEREHTLITARTGDGKTYTSIALMVRDIAHGAEVFWLNPQLTLYHPKDQPLNLRPIAHCFHQVDDYNQILATLRHVYRLAEQRKPLYKAGKNVGHNIALHIDEWPAIYNALGDEAAGVLVAILRECRKLNIWVTMGTQDLLTETNGFSTGARAMFTTKLAGNVDDTTWRAVVGAGVKKIPVAKGVWMTECGPVRSVGATGSDISRIVLQGPSPFLSSLPTAPVQPPSLSLSEPAAATPERKIADSGDSDSADSGQKLSERRIKAVRRAAKAGMSRTLIIDLLGISPNKGYALLDEILGAETNENALQSEAVAA